MAVVKITLTDTEDGQVRIDCDPSQPTLVKMHRAGDARPAHEYGILALTAIIRDSLKRAQEAQKAKDARLVMPDRFSLQ